MNYKNKYNKYKQKYKSLLKKIKGGINPPELYIQSFKKTDINNYSIPTQNPQDMMYCESNSHNIAALLVWILNNLGITYFNQSLDNIISISKYDLDIKFYNDESESQQLIIHHTNPPVSDHSLIKAYFTIKTPKQLSLKSFNHLDISEPEFEITYIRLGSLNLEGLCTKNISKYIDRYEELGILLKEAALDIICFQEMSLKDDESKGWINRGHNQEIIQRYLPDFILELDNYTSMFGFNSKVWKLEHTLEIPRMGKEDQKKKSNAYKLKNKYTECEIIVVNIHLKAGMFEEANRIKELNFIYKVLREFSSYFDTPVFFAGDFNQDFIDIEALLKKFNFIA